MAVKVEGKDESIRKKITCKKCSSILSYLPIDIKAYHGRDMGGGPDGEEWVDCPECKLKVVIRSW